VQRERERDISQCSAQRAEGIDFDSIHQAGLYRISIHILEDGRKIAIVLNERSRMRAAEEMTTAPDAAIDDSCDI
jgi:hypothetical protein